jgi:predicted DNA-binding transcriptional regulator YafY
MRADRLLKMMLLLSRHGKLSAQTLAQRLEVSRRTIYRDLDALTTAGIPVYAEGGPGGGIWLDAAYQSALTGLSGAELTALFVSSEAFPLADLGLAKASEDSLLKLFAAMPAYHRQQIEQYRERIYLDPTGWWQTQRPSVNLFPLLQEAVFNQQAVLITYERNDGQVIRREVQPYGLVAKGDQWYLVGAHSEGFRSYSVSRIQETEQTGKRFERQLDFDLADHWHAQSDRFLQSVEKYAFTLRVNETRLKFLRLYVSGQLEIRRSESEQGWLLVDFTVGGLDAALMIVLGLGTDCEIVAPDALKEQVASYVNLLGTHYRP